MTAGEPELRDGAEPERGLLLAVLPKGADAEGELGELRELARTAGVEPVAEVVQRRMRADPAGTSAGQARGAEGLLRRPPR
jgi:50S ribosomal subunit-associated GTPase HflX